MNTSTNDRPAAARLSSAFTAELRDLFSAEDLLTEVSDCWAYGYDNSKLQALPQAVVLPETESQVEAVVRACHEHQVPLIARGRGTGTTGATVPDHGGIVLSLERMNQILEIDSDNRLARVQPGVLNQTLQDALALASELAGIPGDEAITPVHLPAKRSLLDVILSDAAPGDKVAAVLRWRAYRTLQADLRSTVRTAGSQRLLYEPAGF